MMYKHCRCGKMIPQTMKLCVDCETKKNARHIEYNNKRRNKVAQAFYLSSAWKRRRIQIINSFNGIDILAYFVFREVLPAQEVHHIEELEEAWAKRFDKDNLIPLNHDTHTIITRLYMHSEAEKKQVQKALKMLIDCYYTQGDTEKVLGQMLDVAPTLFLRKNSPLEFSKY